MSWATSDKRPYVREKHATKREGVNFYTKGPILRESDYLQADCYKPTSLIKVQSSVSYESCILHLVQENPKHQCCQIRKVVMLTLLYKGWVVALF